MLIFLVFSKCTYYQQQETSGLPPAVWLAHSSSGNEDALSPECLMNFTSHTSEWQCVEPQAPACHHWCDTGCLINPLPSFPYKSTRFFLLTEQKLTAPANWFNHLKHKWMKCDLESVKVWKLELWFYLHSVASCLSKLDQVSTHFIEAVNLEQISGNIYAI